MFCYNCGEDNPDEAKYCKNCGALLRKEETVKKVEVVETPSYQQNNNHQQTTTTKSSNSSSSDWIGCCLCLIVIFIVFAIFGSI